LVEKGEDILIEPLGGWWGAMGVSSTLIKVEGPKSSFVLKQPLAKLAVKDDWPCDTDRILKEKDCIETLAGIIGQERVPRILFFDKENNVLVMSRITDDWELWKRQLLDGKVDWRVASKVAEILAQIHNKTFKDGRIQEKFHDRKILWQLRIDPYYRTIEKRHSEIRSIVETEVQRLLKTRVCLVHGDYSPKNIFTKNNEIIVLDHEIAHYGDPTMDFAFCLNHLLLKFIHKSIREQNIKYEYLKAAENYCNTYMNSLKFWEQKLNLDTIKELGCLMLARIDGKSPVEYITDDNTKNIVRRISKNILFNNYNKLDQVFGLIDHELQHAEI
jgi:5-methylthioribose kinase